MYSLNNLQICNRELLHIVTMLYITSQNLFHSLKFLPFDYQQSILRTPGNTTLSKVAEDGEPWGLPYTVPGPTSWVSHFEGQCVTRSYGWRYAYPGTSKSTSGNVCDAYLQDSSWWYCLWSSSPAEWENKLWYNHMTKYPKAVKPEELQLLAIMYHKWNVEENNADTKGNSTWFPLHTAQRQAKPSYCLGICASLVNSYFKKGSKWLM